jgi:hypothetical protein
MTKHIKDLEWKHKTICGGEDHLFSANVDGVGRLSVLDRLTGYGWCARDTETSFRDTGDKFWLVSGMFDIRNYPDLTIEEAVAKVKQWANNCTGD